MYIFIKILQKRQFTVCFAVGRPEVYIPLVESYKDFNPLTSDLIFVKRFFSGYFLTET